MIQTNFIKIKQSRGKGDNAEKKNNYMNNIKLTDKHKFKSDFIKQAGKLLI